MNTELENRIMELVEAIQADQFPGPEYDTYNAGEHIYSVTFNISTDSSIDVLMHMQWPRFHMLYHELKRHFDVIDFETAALKPEEVHVKMRVADSIINYVAILGRDECIEMLMDRGVPESTLEADLAGPACEAAAEDLWNEVLKYECL